MLDIIIDILLPFLLVVLYVFFWLIMSEYLSRRNKISKTDARKLLHVMVGNVVLFIPFFGDKLIVTLIPFGFIIFNFFLTPYSPIKKLRMDTFESGHGLGTVWYAISLTILVFFGYDKPWLILAAFFPLAYGDGLAAVIGSRANNGFLWSFGGKKSLIGTWTFIWASFLSVTLGLMIFNFLGIISFLIANIILISIVVAISASILEFISPKGMDNLFIPIGLLILLEFTENTIFLYSLPVNINIFYIGVVFALFFGILGYLTKILTLDGALAGFFMGIIIMGLGGLSLGLALLMFFAIGSFVTKINKKDTTEGIFEKGSVKRDSLQALAKAGFATIIALLAVFSNDKTILIMIFIASLATSLTDTVATEIGIYTKSKPRYILKPWKSIQRGESGGVSFKGTLAGVLTAFIFSIVMFGSIFIDSSVNVELPVISLVIIPIGAVLGMLLDSVLGTTIQEQRKCPVCKKKVEIQSHCGIKTEKISGFSFIKNDTVNLIAVTIGGLLVIPLFGLFSLI
jgi:uncharacterized protein (TIGR00297 family)